jgi:DNA-binding NtrC family response regulator
MATRKTTFEIVPLADIAPLLKDAEVLGNIEGTGPEPARLPTKILSVADDISLATTRAMLLSSVGFQVSSVLAVDRAIELCATEEFALVVIGHSIPLERRKWLLTQLRTRCTTPVLAFRRPAEAPLTEADYTFDSAESPGRLIEIVVDILKPKTSPMQNGRPSE